MHRITQEIPRRAPVFGYGPFTLYGAAFQKLHLTFALPHRAPTTPLPFQYPRRTRQDLQDLQDWESAEAFASPNLVNPVNPVLSSSLGC